MTLYRKYRPKQFSDIVGQSAVKQILLEELKQNHASHAYLFSGPRGTGKTSAARLFAKSLNCAKRAKDGEACMKCQSCVSISEGKSSDLIEIDAASNRRIEEIRELREHVKYVPASSPYKVYIIDEVHMLTNESFNALLKTLEEPPPHVVFILATTELHKIPETIFSRCQHFQFTKLRHDEIVGRLQYLIKEEKVSVEEEILKDIARRSGGALRDAESLLGQILSIGKKSITASDAQLFLPRAGFETVFAWISALAVQDAREAFSLLQKAEDAGMSVDVLLDEALVLSRYMLVLAITDDTDALATQYSADEIERIVAVCEKAGASQLRKITHELLRAVQEMPHSSELPILPLELASAAVCDTAVAATVAPVAAQEKQRAAVEPPKTEIATQPEKPKLEKTAPEETESPKAEVQPSVRTRPTKEAGITHSLEEVLDGWGEVLMKVRDKSQALNFILGVAQPIAVRSGVVELGFKYRLQQEKVSEAHNRMIVEEIIEEVFGASYHVEASIRDDIVELKQSSRSQSGSNQPAISPEASDEEILMKTALEVFDGAVVES